MLRKLLKTPSPTFESSRLAGEPLLAWADGLLEEPDPLTQMALAERADRNLLRLVMSAAAATLVLALASSLV